MRTERSSAARCLVAVLALLASFAACSAVPLGTTAPPGQAARERIVLAYLVALERQDGEAIAAMTNPRVDASAEIAAALGKYGGVRVHDARVAYLDEFGGVYVIARVTGTIDDGSAVELWVPISCVDGNYYLALGRAMPSGSEAIPGSHNP